MTELIAFLLALLVSLTTPAADPEPEPVRLALEQRPHHIIIAPDTALPEGVDPDPVGTTIDPDGTIRYPDGTTACVTATPCDRTANPTPEHETIHPYWEQTP